MDANLFIRHERFATLDDFVAEFSRSMACGPFEERESSNFVDGRYFRCTVLGIQLRLASTDEAGFEDYPFWLHLKAPPAPESGAMLDGLADYLARKWVHLGAQVACPLDGVGALDAAVHYTSKPSGLSGQDREILVELR